MNIYRIIPLKNERNPNMKKVILSLLVLCMVLSGCGYSRENHTEIVVTQPETKSAAIIYPLPDSTMDTIENATFAISLEEGDAYVDDTGIMQMKVKVYSYDLYDMVDIAGLKAGDTIVTHSGEVAVSTVERNAYGTILINGGMEEGGIDLFSDDGGVYYETGFNDAKNWYEVGEVTLRVSADLEFRDSMDLEKGEQIYYAGSFLVGEVTDYYFEPHNTTVRTENGQIVSMERIYTP